MVTIPRVKLGGIVKTARQIAIVKRLKEMGGRLMMHECDHDANWKAGERTYPNWIEQRLGKDGLYAIDTLAVWKLPATIHPSLRGRCDGTKF